MTLKIVSLEGARKEVSLDQRDVAVAQDVHLFKGLHAFGEGLQSEVASQVDKGLHQCA